MTKQEPEIVKREVGERVQLHLTFDAASTKELGDGVLEATVTTSVKDRHNEDIVTSGILTENYLKNPVVLYGHDYWGLPVGKTLSLTTLKNKMKARFQMAVEEYPFAKTVYDMVKAGYLNAVSIGGIVKEWSDDYRTIEQMEMVEFSIVPVPANPEAIITGRSFEEAVGKTFEQVQKECRDFVDATLVDKLAGMGDDEINRAIKSLETLIAALKVSAQSPTSAGESKEVRTIKRIRLMDTAKAVNKESERVIRTLKVKMKEEQ